MGSFTEHYDEVRLSLLSQDGNGLRPPPRSCGDHNADAGREHRSPRLLSTYVPWLARALALTPRPHCPVADRSGIRDLGNAEGHRKVGVRLRRAGSTRSVRPHLSPEWLGGNWHHRRCSLDRLWAGPRPVPAAGIGMRPVSGDRAARILISDTVWLSPFGDSASIWCGTAASGLDRTQLNVRDLGMGRWSQPTSYSAGCQ